MRGGNGRAEGLNLLLHGPVGTGKTEFCKALASQAGCTLWSIGEKDQEGGEPSRGERLAGLRLAQRLLKGRTNAVLLFDEAEDILARPGGFMERHRDESKVFVNRIMEGNRIPVLWTCNDVEHIHAAELRRMTLALEVKTPNRSVRERIWRRVLKSENLAITDGAVRQLAARYETPPAVAATAARAVALAGGDAAEIEQAMVGVLHVLGIGPSVDDRDCSLFEPALTNCDTDLDALVEQLANPGTPRNWSLCIHGAPGPASPNTRAISPTGWEWK
jgi:transitional endoplasmic reticulum ATPase